MDDVAPPPPDLDVVAARAAASLFLRLTASGATRPGAWDEAVALFRRHHPQWPPATLERESARTVGAMILAMELVPETPGACAPATTLAATLAKRLRHAWSSLVATVKQAWRGPAEAH